MLKLLISYNSLLQHLNWYTKFSTMLKH